VSSAPVTAVVVTFQSAAVLGPCLESLAGIRTIVVDNASGDETTRIAKAHAHVEVIEHRTNRGFAAGVNTGLQVAQGDILLLNPDARLREASLGVLRATLVASPGAGIVAPRLIDGRGEVQSSARTFKTVATLAARRTPLGWFGPGKRLAATHSADPVTGDVTSPVDWVLGAAMLVRSEAAAQVGPMDEGFFLYEEDQDWCARMWARGWEVLYEPSALVDHLYQRASRKSWRLWDRATRAHWHSVARFTRKYPERVLLGRPMPRGQRPATPGR
jgi:N-acetylglucosaminyl-diphospho-decaprenol L-rhamnosyltransferase